MNAPARSRDAMPANAASAVRATVCAAALAAALTGCANSSPPPPSAGRTAARYAPPASAAPPTENPAAPPWPARVDGADPGAVAAAATTAMWSADTTTDTSGYQAALRAGALLTPGYAAAIRAAPPRTAQGADWTTWAAHRAYTTATTVPAPDDQPIDTPTTARRELTLTQIPHGRDGWNGPPERRTMFVTLTRTAPGRPWRVAAITVQG